jgi:exonuclease SbcC
MRIRKIKLENIRSYQNEEVSFPEGSTLLSGDIGSGKTSILLGIEFALFGLQPGQRGNALLRNGENHGSVSLEFEVDGKNIIVERTLKRGSKAISQDSCTIIIDGEKKELAVTELKDKVLDLLNYPKEFSRKQNLLYKFTVYTPQEEMKQIISQDPQTRINTLRHVFGIDKYKKIIENASILSIRFREEKRINEALIENFENDRDLLSGKEDELEAKHHNLVSVEKELFLKTEERKKVEEEKSEISGKIEEKNRLSQEIEKTKIMVSNKKENSNESLKLISKIKEQIRETDNLIFDESKIFEIEKKISELKFQKKEIEENKITISGKLSALNLKNKENESLRERLNHIETCPTCLQNVDPVYKSNVFNKLESETSENKKQAQSLTFELEESNKKFYDIEKEVNEKQKQLHEFEIIKVKLKDVNEKKNRISELENSFKSIEQDCLLLEDQLIILNDSVFSLKKFENVFEEKQTQLENSLREERITEIKVAELKKEMEVFSKQIEELKERIKKLETIKEKLDHLIKLETWISKVFLPLISMIEKNVMTKLKLEFSELFSLWFSMLVSDSFEVRLDDNFTPIIEHQDYEIDYAYLSGGERTAIALAYRLSLNQVVNSLLSKIKTRDLVILDEPTDGFSEQQLDKMRDVLRQLDIGQVIIVSHEQKIESFVENIIRFDKEHGISKKTSENFIK